MATRRALSAAFAIVIAAAVGGVAQPALAASDPFTHAATGVVFYPNPVQQTGNENLTDGKDADSPDFAASYHQVTLSNLDGSGTLTGAYVRVKSATGKAAMSTNGAFPVYHRGDDQFEQVMGYYWVNQAQMYLQHLGFGGRFPAANQRQIELRIDQFGGDNSFFKDTKANITLGKGGVDDAEDAEVIVHEYGHSVQDGQVPGFGTGPESGAIGEAFGDYLAVAVTSWTAGTPTLTPEACVADWDSTSYTSIVPHCLRRLDNNKLYPFDVIGEVHADGEIWSRALWDIRNALGDTEASTIIVDAQFGFTVDISFAAAATKTVNTAQSLYGPAAAAAVQQAFHDRGIL
jgi:hypothetical protein